MRLEEEEQIQERIRLWHWMAPRRTRLVWGHDEIGMVWQRDSFQVYHGLDPQARWISRYCLAKNERGWWEAFDISPGRVKSRRRIDLGEPIASASALATLMRIVELIHLDRQGTGKWIGL
jgi:hypothetical protein